MKTVQGNNTITKRGVDWPLVFFFILAYAIAWGTFGIMALIAGQAGLDNAQTLMAMSESYQFEGLSLAVPHWLLYLLTRLADFSFSIAGVIMIAITVKIMRITTMITIIIPIVGTVL